MPIFIQGSKEERNVAELFHKLKDNEQILVEYFDQADFQLIDKCLRELQRNLEKVENTKDPLKEKNKEYVAVLKRTRDRFSRYFHFYTLYEIQLIEELIEKLDKRR